MDSTGAKPGTKRPTPFCASQRHLGRDLRADVEARGLVAEPFGSEAVSTVVDLAEDREIDVDRCQWLVGRKARVGRERGRRGPSRCCPGEREDENQTKQLNHVTGIRNRLPQRLRSHRTSLRARLLFCCAGRAPSDLDRIPQLGR